MQVDNGSVVSFFYTLSDTDGNVIESNREGEPAVYLHGASNIIPKLEEAFLGKQKGDSFELSLSAADGYGERKEDSIERVPAKYFKHAGKLKIAKLNVDDNPDIARRFDVMSIPTLIVFQDGQPAKRMVGAKGKGQLLEELSEFIA